MCSRTSKHRITSIDASSSAMDLLSEPTRNCGSIGRLTRPKRTNAERTWSDGPGQWLAPRLLLGPAWRESSSAVGMRGIGNEKFFPEPQEKIFLFHRVPDGTAKSTRSSRGTGFRKGKLSASFLVPPKTLQDLFHLDC